MEIAMRACGEAVKAGASEAVDNKSGDYRRSLRVTTTRAGGRRHDRAAARVESTDPGALAIEYGTTVRGVRAAQRPLRKGLDALRGL